MSITTDAPPETQAPEEPEPGLTVVPGPDDDGPLDDITEAIMGMPAALLLGANTATTLAASAFEIGGPMALAATATAAGGAAAAAALVRRAHRAEQERQDLAAGKTPNPKAPAQLKAARQARKEARRLDRAARQSRPLTGSRTGGTGGAGARRAGGGLRGRGPGAAGSGRGAGRSGGAPGRHAKTGAHRPTTASRTGGLPTAKTAKTGTPTSSTGATGAKRSLLSRAGGAGRAGGPGGGGLGRRAGAASGRTAGSPVGRAFGSRSGGAGRTASGGRAGGGLARRGASSASAAGRRTVGAGRSIAGGVKRAAGAGQARIGKGSHGIAGSRAGRVATGAGRRAATAARGATGALRRTGQVSRAALAGARSAKGGTPRQVAAAVRRAVARRQAVHAKQAQQAGQPISRATRARRRLTARALGAGAFGGALGWRAARRGGGWIGWAARAAHARATGRPVPAPPGRPAPPARPTGGHPPVAGTVQAAPSKAPFATRTTHPTGGTMLGHRLQQLSEEMHAAAAGYKPTGMLEWGMDMQSLETVLGNVAQVLRALESGADNLPVNPAVKATLGSVAALQQSCSSAAADIHATFRAVHATELDRLENPRPDEQMWDVAANK